MVFYSVEDIFVQYLQHQTRISLVMEFLYKSDQVWMIEATDFL